MTLFASARAAQELDFTHRERREVVVQHELLVELAGDMLDLLFVVGRPQGTRDQRLRFAACKHHRAVGPRQHGGFRPDGPDFVEPAPVESDTSLEYLVAQHFLLQAVENLLRFGFSLGLTLG